MADRARAAGGEDRSARQSSGTETPRAGVGDRQAAMRRQRRDPEAGADVERHVVGQPDRLALRQDDVLLSRPVRALPGCLPEPHALADARLGYSLADGVDRPRSVLIRHDLGERDLPGAA